MSETTNGPAEKALLVEVGLGIVLAIGAILLYWRPAAVGELTPRWWHWLALAILFFAVVALHTWRSRRRSHRALHQAIREDAAREKPSASDPASAPPAPSADERG